MRLAIALLLLTTSVASAHVLRDGANHHLGDDSFFVRFGRAPTADDGEPLRMHVHLQYVHDLLASRPATRPELAERRAELLGYLDDYIAQGTTPENTYVARRNPVFIDATGHICAVGYLIERSVGRALPETIATTHRLDYLEDIAGAMPEVAAWVESSGFTLEELASIQPGYPGPEVMHLAGWLAAKRNEDSDNWQEPAGAALPPNGKYASDESGSMLKGRMAHHQMTGTWTRRFEGKLVGKGTFDGGAGTWKSFRIDGSLLAEGAYKNSHANGEWTVFHPSGRIAAVGKMRAGKRDGVWTFFYDNKAHGKLSQGRFLHGETIGGWKHFDAKGDLVATASGRAWAGLTLVIEPVDGVRHEVHQGIPAESFRMDGFYLGKDRLYVTENDVMFDGDGNRVFKADGGWTWRACKWSAKRKRAAAAADATTIHQMMLSQKWDEKPLDNSPEECEGPEMPVAQARAKHFDAMIASRTKIHAPIPKFDVDPKKQKRPDGDDLAADEPPAEKSEAGSDNPDDMATYLVDHMTWYIEWPHVDDTFRTLYRSLPGYGSVHEGGF